ncbi:MAG: hypothetical protein WC657_03895 [Candidatus Paceibacterota bacterium]|jgi:hypothetical protein
MLEPKIEAKLNGIDWTDISADVIAPVYCSSGIMGNSPTDRVASPGRCTFSLKNSMANSAGLDGYYSPGHVNCRSGFQAGLIIRVSFTFDGHTTTKWYGRIAPDGISVEPHSKGTRRTIVTAYDWMYQATVHTLYLPSYTTSKKMNEVMPLIVANMPIAPLSTSYSAGQDTFASVFDTVRYNTTANAEFQKLAMSELGYVYLRHNGSYDELLVSEDRLYRNNVVAIDAIAVPTNLADHLTDESGNYITTEDGDYIVLDQRQDIDLDNAMSGLEYAHGANLYNWISAVSYPKKIDADATTVLFALNTRVEIEAGETLSGFKITYRDPTGGAKKVAGKDMVTPVADTDYWMDSVSGSDSKDLTADLDVTVTFGTEGAEYSLENTGASTGYVYLQFRGRGIYTYDSVTKIFKDDTSIDKHGTHTLTLDLKYQNDPAKADEYGTTLLARYKNPTSSAKSVTFYGKTDDLVAVFLRGDCGSRIRVSEDQTGINEDYFINGWDFEILPDSRNATMGNLVSYKGYLKRAADEPYIFWELGTVGKSELGLTTIMGA